MTKNIVSLGFSINNQQSKIINQYSIPLCAITPFS